LPAKTNLEMVRIFQQLNGASVIEITIGGRMKIDQPKNKNEPIKCKFLKYAVKFHKFSLEIWDVECY
jgi:hypothetical protein